MNDGPHPYTRIAIIGLLALYLVNGIIYLNRQSITFDEGGHFHFGVQMLKGSTSRAGDPSVTNSKMPVSALNALPRAFEQLLHPGLRKTDNGATDILHGRYITLLISLLIGIYVFKWSAELYGENAGLFSLFLFAFCPNCLANAALVTTDMYSALLLLLVAYYCWKWLRTNRCRDFILFCLFTGLAQLVKQSLFHLYLIIPCLLILYFLAGARRFPGLRKFLLHLGAFLLINLLVINAGFFFQGFGTGLADYSFRSQLFSGWQHRLSFLGHLPLPLPFSFVQGLDMAKYYDQLGGGYPTSSFGNVTILGHSSNGGSFWYYYFVICFFKTPIAILCFLAGSIIHRLRLGSWRSFAQREAFLLLPVVYFFVLMNIAYKSQTSIRQMIFIYPLLYIFCGILLADLLSLRKKLALGFLGIAYLASVAIYFGNYIPYTNEFIPDKKQAYRIVGAANLDFGQGERFLRDYLRSHPQVACASPKPKPGRQAIDPTNFLDVWNLHTYDWLQSYKPVDHIAFDYLIFDIPDDPLIRQYAHPPAERREDTARDLR